MALKQDPKPQFQEGERVLCFHGPLLYEAKCVKVAIKDKQKAEYSNTWTPIYNKQRELQKANQEQYAEGKMRGAAPGKKTSGLQQKNAKEKTKKNKQKTPGNGDGGSTSETTSASYKKRAQADPTVDNEETFTNEAEVTVKIPEELKPRLRLYSNKDVKKKKTALYLPAKKNVDSILADYANSKKSQGNTDNKEYALMKLWQG
uniref:MRG domain-containing protein n=1 Tax=Phocoena sinus TaxID=42100 RepID=A0A8C9BBI2_PHOSS